MGFRLCQRDVQSMHVLSTAQEGPSRSPCSSPVSCMQTHTYAHPQGEQQGALERTNLLQYDSLSSWNSPSLVGIATVFLALLSWICPPNTHTLLIFFKCWSIIKQTRVAGATFSGAGLIYWIKRCRTLPTHKHTHTHNCTVQKLKLGFS